MSYAYLCVTMWDHMTNQKGWGSNRWAARHLLRGLCLRANQYWIARSKTLRQAFGGRSAGGRPA